MCLFIKSGPHITKTNKIVFKILYNPTKSHPLFTNKNYLGESPYMYYTYFKDTIYTSRLFIYTESPIRKQIYQGLHAYTSLKNAKKYSTFINLNHSIKHYKIIKMTIPEGTLYYLGQDGDIVSEILFSGTPE